MAEAGQQAGGFVDPDLAAFVADGRRWMRWLGVEATVAERMTLLEIVQHMVSMFIATNQIMTHVETFGNYVWSFVKDAVHNYWEVQVNRSNSPPHTHYTGDDPMPSAPKTSSMMVSGVRFQVPYQPDPANNSKLCGDLGRFSMRTKARKLDVAPMVIYVGEAAGTVGGKEVVGVVELTNFLLDAAHQVATQPLYHFPEIPQEYSDGTKAILHGLKKDHDETRDKLADKMKPFV